MRAVLGGQQNDGSDADGLESNGFEDSRRLVCGWYGCECGCSVRMIVTQYVDAEGMK